MSGDMVSAEIAVKPGRSVDAARALQERGFRILRTGDPISVQAPSALFSRVFGVSFERATRARPAEAGGEQELLRAVPGTLRIPQPLKHLVSEVLIQEPPDLY